MKNIAELLETIVASPELHKRWLETLSHLENRGAHKIMSFQPKKYTKLFLLQHAAEEARHAFFFKRQIKKLYRKEGESSCFLGGVFLHRYLDLLDLGIARLLKKNGMESQKIRESCYFLTSYTIEVRAKALYHSYESVLRKLKIDFSLRGLLKEEEHHLQEMEDAIQSQNHLQECKEDCLAIERNLYGRFLESLEKEIILTQKSLCA